jgi:hypothetical protein
MMSETLSWVAERERWVLSPTCRELEDFVLRTGSEMGLCAIVVGDATSYLRAHSMDRTAPLLPRMPRRMMKSGFSREKERVVEPSSPRPQSCCRGGMIGVPGKMSQATPGE